MSLLGGWQRIWLVFSGGLLLIHLVVAGFIVSGLPETKFDAASFESRRLALATWQRENHQKCKEAALIIKDAQQANAKYNADGETKSQLASSELLSKIEQAKARLYAIETAGGKYYAEWSKHNDALGAYTQKLSQLRWIPRPFSDEMIHPATRYAVNECFANLEQERALFTDIEKAKEASERALTDIKNGLFGTLVSFLVLSLGLYLAGWCIGWIRAGFNQR
jgi:hypothetical protein